MKNNQPVLKMFFLRHAHKDKKGNLTKKGKNQVMNYLKTINAPDGIEIYHSPIQRAVETANIIKKYSPVFVKKVGKLEELTEEPYSDEMIEKLKINNGKWLETHSPSVHLPSTKIINERIQKLIDYFISESLKREEKSDRNVFFITHAPPIMLHVKHIFENEFKKDRSKTTVLEKMGGFVEPMEGFEVRVVNNSKNTELRYQYKNFKKTIKLPVL